MAELQVYAPDVAMDRLARTIESDGGAIVHDLLSIDAVDQMNADLAAAYTEIGPGSKSDTEKHRAFHGRNTVRFCGLAARSDAFVEHALLNPVMLAMSDHFLLPHGTDYWLNTGQTMAVGPGEPEQILHRDQNNWPEALSPSRELTISCMFALGDFTKENGATVVVPGTHLGAGEVVHGVEFPEAERAYAVMPKGSGMIYSGKVIHGAGENRSDGWRYGLHVSFVVGWLRPEEASPLVVTRERAANLPERARELLGWGSYHSDGGGRTWLVDFDDAERMFLDEAT